MRPVNRTFTLNEAQEILPVVRRLLESARSARQQLREKEEFFTAVQARIILHGGLLLDPIALAAARKERERAESQLRDAVEEITSAGVQLKDIDQGLLDFPCLVDGRMILLCWKLGEESIEFWHSLEDGFAGRKRIDATLFGGSRRAQ